ncbi:dipeptide tripeptide transport protein [Furfurilactobacillus siliginis]|nr:dipeptide tripeptide transport protein [Furfurilactobacillus siliginis]
MWERFSYYGMRAILLFYMYFAIDKGGLGFNQVTATSIMAIYGSLVYLSSVLGGFLSDRVLGPRRTVFIGGVFIMFGHIALAVPAGASALFASIGLIVIGTGLLKPNVSEMVGSLYTTEDKRRDAGFNIFVFGINMGSLVSPIIVGTLGMKVNFHLGFSLAAIGMFFGLLQYWIDGRKYLSKDGLYPSDPIERDDVKPLVIRWGLGIVALLLVLTLMGLMDALNLKNIILLISIIAIATPVVYFVLMLSSRKVTTNERRHVAAYVPLFIAAMLFWAIEEQGSVVLALFAQQRTVLTIGSWTMPAAYFQFLNPMFIMLYTPFFAILWTRLGKRQPSTTTKFAYGLVIAGVSYLFMALPGWLNGTSGRVSMWWLIGSWAIIEVAELLISPIGLSVTTRLAPKAFRSQMMSMWFLADAAGQAVNAQIVQFYTSKTEVGYFFAIGAVSVVLGLVLFLFRKQIFGLMKDVEIAES